MKIALLALAAVGLAWAAPASVRAPAARATQDVQPIGSGTKVPAFRLNDHQGRLVSIAPPKEGAPQPWTVLAFFPKAATPG